MIEMLISLLVICLLIAGHATGVLWSDLPVRIANHHMMCMRRYIVRLSYASVVAVLLAMILACLGNQPLAIVGVILFCAGVIAWFTALIWALIGQRETTTRRGFEAILPQQNTPDDNRTA